MDVLTNVPNLTEKHSELEPLCNKYVCPEDDKDIHVRNPFLKYLVEDHTSLSTSISSIFVAEYIAYAFPELCTPYS